MHSPRSLYGGAITVDAPAELIDASDLRQVPDNQEVFLYPDCSASIIVEILEKVDPADLQDAIKFHFDSLAHDNSASQSTISRLDSIINDRGDRTPSVTMLSGFQNVKKFNRRAEDRVNILMALYRLDEKPIDLVVTCNIPTTEEDSGAVDQAGLDKISAQFNNFIRSLRIVDFGLFA